MPGTRRRTVNITFSSPGAQPPVYVAGEFTEPPWHPVELDVVSSPADASGHKVVTFNKSFQVAEGSWQYKFRLGEGEWWECDPNADSVTDSLGNKNNLLFIKPDMATTKVDEASLNTDTTQPSSLSVAQEGHREQRSLSRLRSSSSTSEFSSLAMPEGESPTSNEIIGELLDASERNGKPPYIGKPPSSLPDFEGEDDDQNSSVRSTSKEEFDSRRKSANDVDKVYSLSPDFASETPTYTGSGSEQAVSPSPKASALSKAPVAGSQDAQKGSEDCGRDGTEATADIPVLKLASTQGDSDDELEDLNSPLLPHERLSFVSDPLELTPEGGSNRNSISTIDFERGRSDSLCCPSATEEHYHDPSIEAFPTGREGILQRVRTLQDELEEDDCSHLSDSHSLNAEHRPKRKSISSGAEHETSNRNRLLSQSGVYLLPTRSSTYLEAIPQEHGGVDGASAAKDSFDAQSLSSYRTAISHSPGMATPHEVSSQQAESRRQSHQVTPHVPSRKSSLDLLTSSRASLGNGAVDGAGQNPVSPTRSESETEDKPLLKQDRGSRQGVTEHSAENPQGGSPVTIRRSSPARYRARSGSPKRGGRGSRSPSPQRREDSAENDVAAKHETLYHKLLMWLKKMFQKLFRKQKDA